MKPSIDNLKLKQKAKSKKQKAKKKKKMVLSIKNCNNKMKKLFDEGTLLPPSSSNYAILSNYLLGLCIYITNPLTSFYVLMIDWCAPNHTGNVFGEVTVVVWDFASFNRLPFRGGGDLWRWRQWGENLSFGFWFWRKERVSFRFREGDVLVREQRREVFTFFFFILKRYQVL